MIWSFLSRIGISIIIGFIFIFLISKFANLDNQIWTAFAAALGCALLYVLSGYFSFYFAFSRSQRSFARVFVISLAIRFILVLVLMVIVLKLTSINQAYFITIFFVWYFVFQIWEVLSLKNISRKKV